MTCSFGAVIALKVGDLLGQVHQLGQDANERSGKTAVDAISMA